MNLRSCNINNKTQIYNDETTTFERRYKDNNIVVGFLIEHSIGEIFKILRRVGNFSFSKLSEGVGMGSEALF